MEYLNKNHKIKKGLRQLLFIVAILFLLPFILHTVLILLAFGVGTFFLYKGVKFIKSKINGSKKNKDFNTQNFEIYENENNDIYDSTATQVIDVEYEEFK